MVPGGHVSQDALPPDDGDEPTTDLPATQSVSAVAGSQSASLGAKAPRSVPSMPKVGIPRSLQKWDRYQVIKVLGAGGMGAVYMARDPRLNRLVALKLVHPGLGHAGGSTGAVFVKRFEREARLQASLDHPHICKVYEIGEMPSDTDDSGYPYIAMQLISGKPLHLAQLEMSLFEKVQVLRKVADAMHAAHRQGLIHRDIKPSNIMVERTADGNWHPYVMDFGLARETTGSDNSRSGIIEGTPRFMAPEQARGDTRHLDRRTDVYALGVTLYEILLGRSPYDGTVDIDILLAVLTVDPKPMRAVDPTIPPDLEAITLKCLEKEQPARYDSAKALADDLQRFIDGEPVLARRIGLTQRLYRQARRHKPLVALGSALLLSLVGLIWYGVRTRLATIEREEKAQKQAQLAQRLGQEISKMEWLLRSARQLPLHDLEREKAIIRKRMQQLQTELSGYGSSGRGLAHYALGRGHLALHEYPQALSELRQAQAEGNDSADVHYALGLLLGKHYEQAMYEARLAGGGEWADKQLKELEPKFLQPALLSLQKSRGLLSDTPGYLEALIAYYQRDFAKAEQLAAAAVQASPWLYEGLKLQGDMQLQRALKARDSGQDEEAKKAFSAAVRHYQDAAQIGQSDAEVYEGLAEAWVRQVEMAATRGQPTEVAYAAAIENSDKITTAEPHSTAGPLKKAYAALLTMAVTGSGTSSMERVQQCLVASQAVLDRDPSHPYARDVAAGCNAFAADGAQSRGEDPVPKLQKALALLEPAVKQYPHFLWGINDLSNVYVTTGNYLQQRGMPGAREHFDKALTYAQMAIRLDSSYLIAIQNKLYINARIVEELTSAQSIHQLLDETDRVLAQCVEKNAQFQQCHINYVSVYARASARLMLAGHDVQAKIQRGKETLATARKLGGAFLDLEQYAALLLLVEARDRMAHKQDPSSSLTALQETLAKCLALSPQDAMCRTILAQAEWVKADFATQQKAQAMPLLQAARAKATLATQSPETYPDAWQVLAESQLRLVGSDETTPKVQLRALQDGLAATDKVFALNPNHALGHATRGQLLLLWAQKDKDALQKRDHAIAATKEMERAIRQDALLTVRMLSLLPVARALTSP